MDYELVYKQDDIDAVTLAECPSTHKTRMVCMDIANFVLGAEARASFETLKAVSGIDLSGVDGSKEEPSDIDKAKQLLSRCNMADDSFGAVLVDKFTKLRKAHPAIITYLGEPLNDLQFDNLHWRDLMVIASLYCVNFMQP